MLGCQGQDLDKGQGQEQDVGQDSGRDELELDLEFGLILEKKPGAGIWSDVMLSSNCYDTQIDNNNFISLLFPLTG